MLAQLNPYESPHTAPDRSWPVPAAPTAPALVRVAERGWHYRRWTVEGRLEAEIEWNARWPQEHLAVNGRLVHQEHALLYLPHFQAVLETSHGPCPIALDVRLWIWYSVFYIDRVQLLRLTIDGQVAYQE